MRRLLIDEPFEVVTPLELGFSLDVVEDGAGYSENATLKALAFAKTGNCLALADDSGIEVDALGGPGPRSARYGDPSLDDEGRTQLMLRELARVPDGERGARYRAVVAVAWPDERIELFEATWEGTIGRKMQGTNGFGYDPIFRTVDGRSAAELSSKEKDAVSHRGQAVRAATRWLRENAELAHT
ncbi:MAG: non-canonical purine NTP pyrophosphatase [Dehalococcoidia bacterium]|nr:non-canonical purine NTP pyrophosphatase [Dehalococcoidia bacterium]